MSYRNPTFAETGAVDCEINHPQYGWIPFTASPTDSEKHGRDLHGAILADGGIAAYVAPTPPTEAERRDTWRTTAKLYRRDFCIALKRAGILSASEAIAAAKGDWPATFASALSGLPQDDQDEAQIEWAAVQEIRRNHPMIALLGTAASMTDAQIDALFGWSA